MSTIDIDPELLPDCARKTLELQHELFLGAFVFYRGTDVSDEGGRARQNAAMDNAMGRIAGLRDAITQILDQLAGAEADVIAEYGEGSAEHGENRRLYEQYIDVARDLVTVSQRIESDYDTRDQP